MSAALRHLTYQFGGHKEQLLSYGSEDAATRIFIIPPLFDEMNRIRHTLVEAMRLLSAQDIAAAMPDLPGSNESALRLSDQHLDGWREAMAEAGNGFGATHTFSVRGGCLVDDFNPTLPVMRLSPAKGKSLLSKMIRTRIAGDKESGVATTTEALHQAAQSGPVELGGTLIGPNMWAQLSEAEPSALPTVGEIKPTDVNGSALWLRAEPQHDAEMAEGLASFMAGWTTA